MKTLFITIITLVFTVSLLAQNYVDVSTTKIHENPNNISPITLTIIDPISKLTLEIYGISNFEYRMFLRKTEESKRRYYIGTEVYTKKQITKLFRKGARRSKTVIEFEKFLTAYNCKFLDNVSERETVDIFNKFREGTLHAYLDSLPSGIF